MRNYATLKEWSRGNPGALSFLLQLSQEEAEVTEPITDKLLKIPQLRGTHLYILWSDLCNREIDKVLQLCEKCPDDVLLDACMRQDYSGRELVKPFLKHGS